MNSINMNTNMNTIFMNSEYSKISDPHRLLLNLTDKIDLRRKDKKGLKKSYKIILNKKHGEKRISPSIRIYVNKIKKE